MGSHPHPALGSPQGPPTQETTVTSPDRNVARWPLRDESIPADGNLLTYAPPSPRLKTVRYSPGPSRRGATSDRAVPAIPFAQTAIERTPFGYQKPPSSTSRMADGLLMREVPSRHHDIPCPSARRTSARSLHDMPQRHFRRVCIGGSLRTAMQMTTRAAAPGRLSVGGSPRRGASHQDRQLGVKWATPESPRRPQICNRTEARAPKALYLTENDVGLVPW